MSWHARSVELYPDLLPGTDPTMHRQSYWLQEVTSHAIDVESDECSCAPSHLAPDERVAACSPFLVMQQTPIGKGTFGTVFK